MMNSKYRSTLCECKKLNGTGLLQKTSALITADKILYDHAIQMVSLRWNCKIIKNNNFFFCFQCQSAALDELFGNPEDCFNRYQTAQILLHSLAQKTSNSQDKTLLSKCK